MRSGLISVDPQAKRFFGGGTFFDALVNEKEWTQVGFVSHFSLYGVFRSFSHCLTKKAW